MLKENNMFFQIARELRLRDIGGIIVVDFIDMTDDCELDISLSLSLSFSLVHAHMCMCSQGVYGGGLAYNSYL